MKPKPPPPKITPAGAQHDAQILPRRVTPEPFRASTPDVRALDSERFLSEPPTKQKNMTASIYQSLLSVFDQMSDEQRMEFVDLASMYGSLDAPAQKDLLEMLPLYAKLRAEERQAVLEAIQSLEPTRRR